MNTQQQKKLTSDLNDDKWKSSSSGTSGIPSHERQQKDSEDEWGAFDSHNSNITSSKGISDHDLKDFGGSLQVDEAFDRFQTELSDPPSEFEDFSGMNNATSVPKDQTGTTSDDSSWETF